MYRSLSGIIFKKSQPFIFRAEKVDFTLDLFILHADQTKNSGAEINSAAYEPNNRNSYFVKKKVTINIEQHATAFLPPNSRFIYEQ